MADPIARRRRRFSNGILARSLPRRRPDPDQRAHRRTLPARLADTDYRGTSKLAADTGVIAAATATAAAAAAATDTAAGSVMDEQARRGGIPAGDGACD